MNIGIRDTHVIFSHQGSLFDYFGWPSVARLQNGKIAVAASGFRVEHVCPFGKAVIAYSEDEGKTFTLPAPVIDTTLDDRDAGIMTFGKSGAIFTSFNNTNECQQKCLSIWRAHHDYPDDYLDFVEAYLKLIKGRHMDEGQYGSTFRISRDCGVTWGPILHSPVSAPHGPIETADGRILYIGRLQTDYLAPVEREAVECWEMDEDGHMTYLSEVPKYDAENGALNCEPHAIGLPDGRILVHTRVQGGKNNLFGIAQCESSDGGKTFSAPRLITETDGGAPAHLLLHSSGVLISVVGHRVAPMGLRVLLSRDMGRTWETHTLTDDAPNGDLGYPATCELADGRLFTVWYQHGGDATEGSRGAVILGGTWQLP